MRSWGMRRTHGPRKVELPLSAEDRERRCDARHEREARLEAAFNTPLTRRYLVVQIEQPRGAHATNWQPRLPQRARRREASGG